MAIVQLFLYSITTLFLGYVLGRIGHCYINVWMGNPSWAPHHWIYGVALVPVSFYFPNPLEIMILCFGVGLFVSDLKDFWELKFFAPDEEGEKRFFHID